MRRPEDEPPKGDDADGDATAGGRPPIGARPGAGSTARPERLVVLNGRRPRFLVRRAVGRPVVRPLAYRGREITPGAGR